MCVCARAQELHLEVWDWDVGPKHDFCGEATYYIIPYYYSILHIKNNVGPSRHIALYYIILYYIFKK